MKNVYQIGSGELTFDIIERIINENLKLELASEDSVFEHPAWLGEEVTGQPGYYNSFLARNPYKTWKQTTETKSKGDKTE